MIQPSRSNRVPSGPRKPWRHCSLPLLLGSLALPAIAGCEAPPPQRNECLVRPIQDGVVVARVGDVPITVEQVVSRANEQGRATVRRLSDAQAVRHFVEDQVRMELLAQAAIDRGLHRDPEVVEVAQKVMVRKLLERDMGAEAFAGKVSEKKIQSFYERHRDEYVQPEKRRFADIQLPNDAEGQALGRDLLAQLRARPDDRRLFHQFAQAHSTNRLTKNKGGEGLHRSHSEVEAAYGRAFADRIFAAAPDELIQELVPSTQGLHVVRVVAVREALTRGVDEVREDIVQKLLHDERTKAFDGYLSELKRRFPVAIYDDQIEDVIRAIQGDTSTKDQQP